MGCDCSKSERLMSVENRMLQRMCTVRLRDEVSSEILRHRMRLMSIAEAMRMGRLRWFGHVKWRRDDLWVKRCMDLGLQGRRPVGRSKMTWMEVVRKDMKEWNFEEENADDRVYWNYRRQCKDFRRT
jgi:hypothetical protein